MMSVIIIIITLFIRFFYKAMYVTLHYILVLQCAQIQPYVCMCVCVCVYIYIYY